MVTPLPIRIEFALPPGWVPAPPDDHDASDCAFLALHPDAGGSGSTPSITIAGAVSAVEKPLEAYADESVAQLESTFGARVRVAARTTTRSSLVQLLGIVGARGAVHRLVQSQTYLGLPDVDDPTIGVVLQLVLTCSAEQFDGEHPDFTRFVRTVRSASTRP